MLFLMGAGLGAISFSAATALIPFSFGLANSHSGTLAINLVFIYPALLGLWVGWIRRSARWAIFGFVTGMAAAGSVCIAVYGTIVFVLPLRLLQLAVVVPCVLGGAMSALLGTKTESRLSGALQRLVRGVIAGFLLGFIYGIIFVLLFPMSLPEYPYFKYTPFPNMHEPENLSAAWIFRLWISGTLAFTISSAFFLTVFYRSAGFSSTRSVGDERSVATEAAEVTSIGF